MDRRSIFDEGTVRTFRVCVNLIVRALVITLTWSCLLEINLEAGGRVRWRNLWPATSYERLYSRCCPLPNPGGSAIGDASHWTSGLGAYRWVVERTPGWLHQFRRLRVRYEGRADIYEAFLSLGCSIICFRCLTSFC